MTIKRAPSCISGAPICASLGTGPPGGAVWVMSRCAYDKSTDWRLVTLDMHCRFCSHRVAIFKNGFCHRSTLTKYKVALSPLQSIDIVILIPGLVEHACGFFWDNRMLYRNLLNPLNTYSRSPTAQAYQCPRVQSSQQSFPSLSFLRASVRAWPQVQRQRRA